jgi:hypothetical protein
MRVAEVFTPFSAGDRGKGKGDDHKKHGREERHEHHEHRHGHYDRYRRWCWDD